MAAAAMVYGVIGAFALGVAIDAVGEAPMIVAALGSIGAPSQGVVTSGAPAPCGVTNA
jgi:hypothetical protein